MKNKDEDNIIKKMIIFGGEGQLGSDMTGIISSYKIISLGHKDVDITDFENVKNIINKHKPSVVINCAAYNKVEDAENNIVVAYNVNAFGPYYIARASKEVGATCVHISTDYVFDGSKESFNEKDCPHPINVYGASKLAGEELVRIGNPEHYIVRTSALFGKAVGGSKGNFVTLMIRLSKDKKEIRVVNDQITVPTFTEDLAIKILELVDKKAPYGVYHITNQGQASWCDFARKIFNLAGISAEIKAISTKESGTKVRRSQKSVLKNEKLIKLGIKLLSPWQDALKRYLNIIKE